MIIDIDGHVYTVPAHIEEKMVGQLYMILLEKYQKLEKPIRLALKPVSRHYLQKLEKELNKLGKDGKSIRPQDGEDPTLHYARIALGTVQEGLKDAEINIDTQEGSDTITAFNLSITNYGEAGGPLSFGGDIGQREDNGSEDVRPGIDQVVSHEQTLHS